MDGCFQGRLGSVGPIDSDQYLHVCLLSWLCVSNPVEQREVYFKEGFIRCIAPIRLETLRLGQRLIRAGIEESLERLGVHFDVWKSESSLHEEGWVSRSVERLREEGQADLAELWAGRATLALPHSRYGMGSRAMRTVAQVLTSSSSNLNLPASLA